MQLRKPQDRLGQRILVYELRHAIDRCMKRPWDTVARQHLDTLIEQNPRSTFSTHVLYNIGMARREWLLLYTAETRAAWMRDAAIVPEAAAELIRRALVGSLVR